MMELPISSRNCANRKITCNEAITHNDAGSGHGIGV
jgi:hypothetical protein